MMGGIGGLVGMIIHGVGQEEHFRAVGEKAAQIFDQVGGHSKKLSSELGSSARTLSKWYGIAEGDIQSVTTSLATLGVKSTEASQKMEGLTGVAGKNLVTAMLAADKAFEMSAGTMAKMAGTMSADFNMPIKEATASMINFGAAASKAGFNAIYMMQGAMQAASAFRLLNANVSGIGGMSMGLANTMTKRGFNTAYAQQYATEGMQQAMGAAAGLDVGMSAIIGERMGHMGSGLDAWYSLKSGSGMSERGMGEMKPEDIIKQMGAIVGELSPNRSEQAYALTKLFGVDVAGADAILDAMKEQEHNGKLSEESLKKINTAFQSEGQKQNQMLQMVEVIKDAVAKGSIGLLQVIVNSLKLLYDAVQWGFHAVMALIPGEDQAYNQAMAATYKTDMGKDLENATKGAGAVWDAAKTVYKAIGIEKDIFAVYANTGDSSAVRAQIESTRYQNRSPQQKTADVLVGTITDSMPGGGQFQLLYVAGKALMKFALSNKDGGRSLEPAEGGKPG